MSSEWTDYLRLLEESAGLADLEARGIAEAEAAHAAEARRLQNGLAVRERELQGLKDRNTRLQVGVRDLSRTMGVPIPPAAGPSLLEPDAIPGALKSAEYDLDQMRMSVEYLKQQKERLAQPAPAPSVQPTPRPAAAPPPPVSAVGDSKKAGPSPLVIGVGIAALVLLVIIVAIVAG